MSWQEVFHKLETGEMRAANKVEGVWLANTNVKKAILEAFKDGVLKEYSNEHYRGFVDKDNLPTRTFSVEEKIRLVPGGSSVRSGAYVASGTVIMPPSYINVGAYVGAGSMVDSHVLVGSCAQVGEGVHLSAGVQIGGVLEPIGARPVIIEDHAFIGAGAVIVEGVEVGEGAVIAPGVVLSKGIPVYDCVSEQLLTAGQGIPPNAVVVPGSRAIGEKNPWAKSHGLSLQCAIIIKYKDQKTKAALELEQILR